MSILLEKKKQTLEILKEKNIDMWLTFVRETSGVRDPVLDFLVGPHDLTWQSALIFTQKGDSIAVIGTFETETIRGNGVFDELVGYDTAISGPLRDTLKRIDPNNIAINTSHNNIHADGLTHGLYEILHGYLKDTPYVDRLVSAESIINALRGRKTPTELGRIKKAVEITDEIYKKTFDFIKVGMTEIEIGAYMQKLASEYKVGLAWPADGCPIVNSGPESPVGHSGPTGIKVERGHIVHLDFGVKYEGYCSDIQRVGYVLRDGETQAPPEVQRGFDTIRMAVEKSREAMNAGVTGNSIDVIAREVLTDSGYPEYMHALGHQLGRVAHDGGALLGPLWEKYGDSPNQLLEIGQVFTVEPGLAVPNYGYINLEEDVTITKNGAEYFTAPQTEIVLIR